MTGVQPSSPVDVEIASKADQERVFGTRPVGPGLCNCEFPDKKKLPPATGSTGARLSSNCHVQRPTIAPPSPHKLRGRRLARLRFSKKCFESPAPLVAVSATVCRLQVPGTRSRGPSYSDQASANYVAVANSRRASLSIVSRNRISRPGRGVATRQKGNWFRRVVTGGRGYLHWLTRLAKTAVYCFPSAEFGSTSSRPSMTLAYSGPIFCASVSAWVPRASSALVSFF
jgi:hypothetical protein